MEAARKGIGLWNMSNLKKAFIANRPPLREVAPLSYYIILGFSMFDIALALSYKLILAKIDSLQIITVFNVQTWVIIFGVLGGIKLVLLLLNDWDLLKKFLAAGIIVKTLWFFQLFSISITSLEPFVILSTLVWLVILYFQISTFYYFTPVGSD